MKYIPDSFKTRFIKYHKESGSYDEGTLTNLEWYDDLLDLCTKEERSFMLSLPIEGGPFDCAMLTLDVLRNKGQLKDTSMTQETKVEERLGDMFVDCYEHIKAGNGHHDLIITALDHHTMTEEDTKSFIKEVQDGQEPN